MCYSQFLKFASIFILAFLNQSLIFPHKIIYTMLLQKSSLCFYRKLQNQINVYKLTQQVLPQLWGSNSLVFSLAGFIIQKFPNLPHPIHKQPPSTALAELPGPWLHPMFEPWLQLICDSILDGKAYRYQNSLYVGIEIDEIYEEVIEKQNFIKVPKNKDVSICDMFDIQDEPLQEKKKKRIGFLNFAISQLRVGFSQPKIHLLALFLGIFFDNQKWSYYEILKEPMPEPRQLANNDLLILPGATVDILNKSQQVLTFITIFCEAFKLNPSLKILCICYGHQLLLQLSKATIQKRKKIMGLETIYFSQPTLQKYTFLKPLTHFKQGECKLPQNHDEFVVELPEDYDLVGESESSKVEAAVRKDGNVFGLQFHPEYLSEYTEVVLRRELAYGDENGRISKFDFGIKSQEELQLHHRCCIQLRKCMKLFIDSE